MLQHQAAVGKNGAVAAGDEWAEFAAKRRAVEREQRGQGKSPKYVHPALFMDRLKEDMSKASPGGWARLLTSGDAVRRWLLRQPLTVADDPAYTGLPIQILTALLCEGEQLKVGYG